MYKCCHVKDHLVFLITIFSCIVWALNCEYSIYVFVFLAKTSVYASSSLVSELCKSLSPCLWPSVCVLSRFSRVWRLATPWTIVRQTPLFMGFSGQEHWTGLPFPSPGGLPDPRMEPASLVSPALAGEFFTTEPSGKPRLYRVHTA